RAMRNRCDFLQVLEPEIDLSPGPVKRKPGNEDVARFIEPMCYGAMVLRRSGRESDDEEIDKSLGPLAGVAYATRQRRHRRVPGQPRSCWRIRPRVSGGTDSPSLRPPACPGCGQTTLGGTSPTVSASFASQRNRKWPLPFRPTRQRITRGLPTGSELFIA